MADLDHQESIPYIAKLILECNGRRQEMLFLEGAVIHRPPVAPADLDKHDLQLGRDIMAWIADNCGLDLDGLNPLET